jgi:hypothetical protein
LGMFDFLYFCLYRNYSIVGRKSRGILGRGRWARTETYGRYENRAVGN